MFLLTLARTRPIGNAKKREFDIERKFLAKSLSIHKDEEMKSFTWSAVPFVGCRGEHMLGNVEEQESVSSTQELDGCSIPAQFTQRSNSTFKHEARLNSRKEALKAA